jgi:hypothetical protein
MFKHLRSDLKHLYLWLLKFDLPDPGKILNLDQVLSFNRTVKTYRIKDYLS